jgi:hypothetical protein
MRRTAQSSDAFRPVAVGGASASCSRRCGGCDRWTCGAWSDKAAGGQAAARESGGRPLGGRLPGLERFGGALSMLLRSLRSLRTAPASQLSKLAALAAPEPLKPGASHARCGLPARAFASHRGLRRDACRRGSPKGVGSLVPGGVAGWAAAGAGCRVALSSVQRNLWRLSSSHTNGALIFVERAAQDSMQGLSGSGSIRSAVR